MKKNYLIKYRKRLVLAMEHSEIFDLICKPAFETTNTKLTNIERKVDEVKCQLNEFNIRVDRLEQRAATQTKIIWILAGCMISGFASLIFDSFKIASKASAEEFAIVSADAFH